MRDFSLPLTVRSLCAVRRGPRALNSMYVVQWPRVIPQKVTSHVTKNPNNTGDRRASVYIGKKTVKNRRSFKKPHFRGKFFDSGFFAVFRGSCLATSNKNRNVKTVFFFMPV